MPAAVATPRPITEPFIFEINFAYPNLAGINISEYALVDITSLDDLPLLLKSIEGADVRLMAAQFSEN